MQLTVVGIAAGRQGGDEEATIRGNSDRLKWAWFLVDACVVSNTMGRCCGIDPANLHAHGHDSHRGFIVRRTRLKDDLYHRIEGSALRRCSRSRDENDGED